MAEPLRLGGPVTVAATALSLAHLSLIACDCETLVRHAAEAGFDAVDLRLAPATPTDRCYSAAERLVVCRQLLPLLRSTGVRVWDVEIIRIDTQTRAQDHLPLMEAAALLGARRLKVVAVNPDETRVATVLAELCVLAAPFGLVVDLEYMVFTAVKSLAAALRIVRMADQPNLQVLVDALHWMRAGDGLEQIRAAPPALLGYVQLCDGPLRSPGESALLLQEARTARLVPGEGEFPLTALLEAMPQVGMASLEVPLPPGRAAADHAQRLLRGARALLDRVGGKITP